MCFTYQTSFDFDDTLSEEWIQSIALSLSYDNEIWIVSARGDFGKDLLDVAAKLMIPRERIILTEVL